MSQCRSPDAVGDDVDALGLAVDRQLELERGGVAPSTSTDQICSGSSPFWPGDEQAAAVERRAGDAAGRHRAGEAPHRADRRARGRGLAPRRRPCGRPAGRRRSTSRRAAPSGETSAHIALGMSAGSSRHEVAPGQRGGVGDAEGAAPAGVAAVGRAGHVALERQDQRGRPRRVPGQVADVVEALGARPAGRAATGVRRPLDAGRGPCGTGPSKTPDEEARRRRRVVRQALEVLERHAAARRQAPAARVGRAGRARRAARRAAPSAASTAGDARGDSRGLRGDGLADRLGEHEAHVLLDDLELLRRRSVPRARKKSTRRWTSSSGALAPGRDADDVACPRATRRGPAPRCR